jgi:hypothetical protein
VASRLCRCRSKIFSFRSLRFGRIKLLGLSIQKREVRYLVRVIDSLQVAYYKNLLVCNLIREMRECLEVVSQIDGSRCYWCGGVQPPAYH